MSKLKFKVGDRVKVTDDAGALIARCSITDRSGQTGVIKIAQHSGECGYQILFDCDQESWMALWISEDLMDHVQEEPDATETEGWIDVIERSGE